MVRWLSIVGCMNQLHDQRSTSLRWGPRLLRDVVAAPDLATAAAHLACAGVPVFPCAPGGKPPLTVHGFQDASIDRGIVTAWWGRHPDANIGVPTGVLGGIDVVDVDVHEGGSRFASFNQARRAELIEGWACLVRKPRVACTRLPPPNVARSTAATILQPRTVGHLTLRTVSDALGGASGSQFGPAAWLGEPSGRPTRL